LVAIIVAALGLARIVTIPYITPAPAPVSEVLSGARVVYKNNFNRLPASRFDYEASFVDLSNGVAEIRGNTSAYPFVSYFSGGEALREGTAVLVLFRYTAGAQWNTSFLSGYYDTARHRAWGITEETDKFTVEVDEWYDIQPLEGSLSLKPDTWYYYLLAVDDGPVFLAYVWERDNPANFAQIRQQKAGEYWEDRGWIFWVQCTRKSFIIDELTEINFGNIR
jgi:hypothetical protein